MALSKIYICLIASIFAYTALRADTPNDTTQNHQLKEMVVSAPRETRSGSKTIYMPPKALRDNAGNAVRLLAGMQVPQLIVNPATGTIEISGGGKLLVRINGRPASATDLSSIAAADITKVEYDASPGIRYADDIAAILDISVRRRDTGYALSLNLLQSPNRGWGDYTAALRYNIGRSEWSVDYHSNPMWHMDCYRDNTEHIITADGTAIVRTEQGDNAPNRMVTHRAAVQYSYAVGRDMLFNVQGRIFRRNDRYITHGNITTTSSAEPVIITDYETELNPITSWQADLDIYCQKRFSKSTNIYLNIVPSLIDSRSSRIYQAAATNLSSTIDGRDYRLLAEGVLEQKIAKGLLTVGYRADGAWIGSDYTTADDASSLIHSQQNSLSHHIFGQWSQKTDIFSFEAGMGLTYYHLAAPICQNHVFPNPMLAASIRHKGNTATISARLNTMMPGISDLNATMQQIDSYQWFEGDVNLKPYRQLSVKADYERKLWRITMNAAIEDIYHHDPIMTAKIYRDAMIVQKPCNSGFNNELILRLRLRVPIIQRKLSLTVNGGWHSFVSKGLNYRHQYSQPFVNAQMTLTIGHWWAMISYNNSYNKLWGEMLTSANQNLTNIGAGYTYKAATFMAGLVNPFGNVALKSRDMSQIAGVDRTYQAADSQRLIWLGVTINIKQGANRAASRKKLDNDQQYETLNNAKK